MHLSSLLRRALHFTRQISLCFLELATELLHSVPYGFRLEHRMLEPRQQFLFQPVFSDLEAIWACPTVKVLRTSISSMSSAASPGGDYQIPAANSTFHDTAECQKGMVSNRFQITTELPTTRPELNVPLSKRRNRRSAPTSRLQRYLAPSQPDTRIRSHLLAGSKT